MAIPKIIHQTISNKKTLHPVFLENITRLKALNPGWDYRLYDDEERLEFIRASYDREFLRAYERINPLYGPARADFFRYLLLYKVGGVYLDIKSTLTKALDDVLKSDDELILSRWPDKKAHRHYGWGRHPALGVNEEYQQWHIVAAPNHRLLEAVISQVRTNIENYDAAKDGVGRLAVVKITGPVAYTLGIQSVKDCHNYRIVDIEDLGFKFSFLETPSDPHAHKSYFENNSYRSNDLLIAPRFDASGKLVDRWEKIPRNNPCPCGSGKRYKHCHGAL